MIFFIGPVTIQLISNVVFFILTSIHCNKVKAEIKRVTSDPADPRSKRFHSDRNRYVNFPVSLVIFVKAAKTRLRRFAFRSLNGTITHKKKHFSLINRQSMSASSVSATS